MFCYSLLECPNNVCVCVWGGFLWVNMYVHVVESREHPGHDFPGMDHFAF